MTDRVLNDNGTTIMWDVPVFADQTTLANRSGVVLKDKKKDKTCLLIDIAIPNDSKVKTKTESYAITKIWRSKSAGCGK